MRNHGRRWPLFAVGITLLSCSPHLSPPVPGDLAARPVELQGHRGARGRRPENTLPAFQFAIESGVTTLELDVTLTADHQLILHHDLTTNPQLCLSPDHAPVHSRRVDEMTVAELKTLDCGTLTHPDFPQQQAAPGAQLPTLQEFFAFIERYESSSSSANRVRFNVELKIAKNATDHQSDRVATIAVDAIVAAKVVERTTIQSFHRAVLPKIKALHSQIQTAALYRSGYWSGFRTPGNDNALANKLLDETVALGVDILSPNHRSVNRGFVREAHRRDLKIIPWTVNSAKRMRELLQMGVDGIISDYPELLVEIHAAHSQSASN